MKFNIKIPLKPTPKQSFRGAIYNKDGKPIIKDNRVIMRAYQPARLTKWKQTCSFIIYSEMKKKNIEIFLGPVHLTIIFFIKPPKRTPKKNIGRIIPDTKPDLDNYEKMLNDACSKILFRDDSQISRKEVFKRYLWKQDEEPYIILIAQQDDVENAYWSYL